MSAQGERQEILFLYLKDIKAESNTKSESTGQQQPFVFIILSINKPKLKT